MKNKPRTLFGCVPELRALDSCPSCSVVPELVMLVLEAWVPVVIDGDDANEEEDEEDMDTVCVSGEVAESGVLFFTVVAEVGVAAVLLMDGAALVEFISVT